MSPRLCGGLLVIAGVYLFTIPLWVDPLFAWMLTSVGDGMAGIVLAATVLLLLPLTLMSVFTPFAVRLLLVSVAFGGRIVSYVYGVSTVGNVLGTLVTTFVLVPSFGSRALTMIFAGVTIALRRRHDAVRPFPARGGRVRARHWRSALLLLAAPARRPSPPWSRPGAYPEGLMWHDGRIYFTEMGADRVIVIENGSTREFWRLPGCGPTQIVRFGPTGFVVDCHLGRAMVEVSAAGVTGRKFATNRDGQPLQNPNAAVSDGQGGAYFSDAGQFDLKAPATGRVYHLSADGRDDRGGRRSIRYANGVNFDPASRTLYVSEHLARRVLALTLDSRQRVTARKVLIDFAQIPATREFMAFRWPGRTALRCGRACWRWRNTAKGACTSSTATAGTGPR